MNWRVVFTKQAQKDAKKLSASDLKQKAEALINILRENPYQVPPPYEKLLHFPTSRRGVGADPCGPEAASRLPPSKVGESKARS